MAKQILNIGTVANDGTGDTIRAGGSKINDNFTELYDGKQNSRISSVKSTNYVLSYVANTDYVFFLTGTTTITLPSAVANTNRHTFKSVSGTSTVNCDGEETIEGVDSITIQNEDSVDLVSNGTEWKVI